MRIQSLVVHALYYLILTNQSCLNGKDENRNSSGLSDKARKRPNSARKPREVAIE